MREVEFERDGAAVLKAGRGGPAIAGRAAALFRLRERSRPSAVLPLPLTDAERRHYARADFAYDASGVESFRGLNRAESLDYIELQRIGLDNDDTAFLRLIQLGDRHASAMRIAEGR